MAGPQQPSVARLADELSEGFAALSGEYQALFEQQKLLESRLSWAKQQVRMLRYCLLLFYVMNILALDLQLLAAL
jgi:hypothetical protein